MADLESTLLEGMEVAAGADTTGGGVAGRGGGGGTCSKVSIR